MILGGLMAPLLGPLMGLGALKGSCPWCGTVVTSGTSALGLNCPACKKPVRKIISTFSSPVKLKPLSVTDAKKSGFQVYKRLGKGEYERQ